MKKVLIALLGLLCGLLFSACGAREEDGENVWQVYYVSNSETKVEMHSHEMESSDPADQLDELIQCLSTNPEKLENKAMSKSDNIKRYEFWGLVLFVGIPLPGTGAWTGSLIAALLDVDFKKAVLAELLGIAIATVIMSIFSYGLLGVLL